LRLTQPATGDISNIIEAQANTSEYAVRFTADLKIKFAFNTAFACNSSRPI
jgi:hypothetical protein